MVKITKKLIYITFLSKPKYFLVWIVFPLSHIPIRELQSLIWKSTYYTDKNVNASLKDKNIPQLQKHAIHGAQNVPSKQFGADRRQVQLQFGLILGIFNAVK